VRLPERVRSAGAALVGRVPVPVLGGPNAGRLWTLSSAGRGYVTGRFEPARIGSILALLRPGDCLWDAGAHKGYVSLAAARRVGPAGQVYAIEPARDNLRALRRHIAWNRPGNVEVCDFALSDSPGEASFGGSGSSITYRLGGGSDGVRVETIAGLVERGEMRRPSVLKIDVEGAEAAVLAGAGGELERVALLFVAIHDRAAYDGCREVLDGAGFRVVEGRKMRRFTEAGEPWSGDADLVAWRDERGLEVGDVRAQPAYRE